MIWILMLVLEKTLWQKAMEASESPYVKISELFKVVTNPKGSSSAL